MVFEGLSSSATLLAAAAAGVAVAALHFLRTQPRDVDVVTTLFWREALAARQPRRLWQRLRRFLTLLLLAAIAACVIAALSAPLLQRMNSSRRYVVFVLDAGLAMTAPCPDDNTRLEKARTILRQRLESLGASDRVSIVACDPFPRVVHNFDQPVPAARDALDALHPVAVPAQSSAALALAHHLLAALAHSEIVHLTADESSAPNNMGDTSTDRVPRETVVVGEAMANAAILDALIIPGDEQEVRERLHLRVGAWGDAPQSINLRARRVDTDAILLDTEATILPGSSVDFVTPPLDFNCASVAVELGEPEGTQVDNRLTVQVPCQPAARVAVGAGVPDALRVGLRTLGYVLVPEDSDDAAFEVLKPETGMPPSDRPRLVIVDDGHLIASETEIRPVGPDSPLAGLTFANVFCGPGVTLNDQRWPETEPLLVAGNSPLAALDSGTRGTPQILLAEALFAAEANLVDQPVFIELLVRLLELLGEPHRNSVTLTADRAARDPVGADELTRRSVTTTVIGTRRASDLASITPSTAKRSSQDRQRSGVPWHLALLAVALLGMLIDGVLHARGRIV